MHMCAYFIHMYMHICVCTHTHVPKHTEIYRDFVISYHVEFCPC